jgi:lipoprotein NlpD
VPVRPAAPAAETAGYIVQAGDTLYSISFKRSLDYRQVARWNGIGSDYRIYVGQTLRLTPPPAGAAAEKSAMETRSAGQEPPAGIPPHWRWPADGPVLGTVAQPTGGVGLKIGGSLQTEIRAAAAGKVVYTGSGLRAYGLLVIVKHDDTWLSAYGYNQDLLVHEGDPVQEGQVLAHMGEGPGGTPMLYFEIRSQGRPVDPLKLLPRR